MDMQMVSSPGLTGLVMELADRVRLGILRLKVGRAALRVPIRAVVAEARVDLVEPQQTSSILDAFQATVHQQILVVEVEAALKAVSLHHSQTAVPAVQASWN